jgi:hypothetical protein
MGLDEYVAKFDKVKRAFSVSGFVIKIALS